MERLATTDKATIVIERQLDGKMRVTSGSWDEEKVILGDQVLEARNVDGLLHITRKPRDYSARKLSEREVKEHSREKPV